MIILRNLVKILEAANFFQKRRVKGKQTKELFEMKLQQNRK